jgi:hypothetical protein
VPLLISAMVDLMRYQEVTPMFVDMVPPGASRGRAHFDPSRYLVAFDKVLHQ